MAPVYRGILRNSDRILHRNWCQGAFMEKDKRMVFDYPINRALGGGRQAGGGLSQPLNSNSFDELTRYF